MPSWPRQIKLVLALGLLTLLGCQSQAQSQNEPVTKAQSKTVELEGVDTSKLTVREKEHWSKYVTELLAPCSNQPVSLAQCVMEKRDCDACLPASQFLAAQVTKGKTRSQAEAAFRIRFAEDTVQELELGNSPKEGAADPSVTVVEWADFECPFCGMASPLIDSAVKKFPDQVRFVFKHFPLSMHEHAEGAARAAAAAGKQGKFWAMHHALFSHQNELDDAGLAKLAKELGLDVVRFEADRKSEAVADAVTADRKQGEKLGLQGTPSLFINGRKFDLDHFDLTEDLEDWLALEIRLRSGKAPAGAGPVVDPKPKAAAGAGQTGTP